MKGEEQLPKWATLFLKTVCPVRLVEEIEGDILQKYEQDLKTLGERKAKQRLFSNILLFLRPGIFGRKRFSIQSNQTFMWNSHFKTALRVARRQRLYTFINVMGLSIGIAATLLIGIYIYDELSYDHFVPDADRIYRVAISEIFKGEEILYADSGAPLAEAMSTEIPEVESAVRVSIFSNTVQYEERAFIERKFALADSNFFQFFGYRLLEGSPQQCLVGPNKLVISESLAKKYFNYGVKGVASPVGKQLRVGDRAVLSEVTGIFADFPENTHMKMDMILSAQSNEYSKNDCWACYGFKTYFKTVKLTGTEAIEKKLEEFAQRRIIPRIEKDLGVSHEEFVKSGDRVSFFVQPLLSIHLESNIEGEFEPNGDILYVYTFGIVAVFLILIACINFMNLATARAIVRAKEIGVRKTMGATRIGLIPQFMMESFMYVFFAGLIAIVIFYATLDPFNTLTGKSLDSGLLFSPNVILLAGALLTFVALLAGSYPSFYLTSFEPVTVLKSGTKGGSPRSILRNALVVVQFTISIALIIGTLIVFRQVKFIQNQHLGFNRENILTISQTRVLGTNAEAFKQELLSHTDFTHASYAQALPPNIENTFFVKAENSDQLLASYFTESDYDLQVTMGYEMKSGRFFSREFASDSSAVVINEACARLLGYDTHENKSLSYGENGKWNVIGIVKDFNYTSLRSSVQPLVIFLRKNLRTMAVRMTPGNVQAKVALVESLWKKHSGGKAFEYSFVDEDFDKTFRSEQRLSTVFATFTVIAIFIACLGLFGLITYIAGQRVKEISIRKVLGANVGQITLLLLRDLITLVMVAFLIAVPLAWYGMEKWLQSFAYRVNFDAYSVMIAGTVALLIAVVTVGYRSVRAAGVNPVDSLKNE